MVDEGNKPPTRKLNAREEVFARHVVSGESQASAWRKAYKKTKAKDRTAAEKGSMMAARPWISERIAELRAKSDAKTLLSLNDRLGILARDAQLPGTSAAMANARARSIEVYNKTAGDHAPDRQEVTVKGDAANPVAVTVRTQTKAEKIAALVAARAAGRAPAAHVQ